MKEEAELDSVILQTHPWCWPAVLMGFPCSTPSVLDTSPPLPTVNRQNGLLLHRQNRSHLEATSLTNLQTASPHTHPFRPFPDTVEVCDPSLVYSMPQTQGLCLSFPIPFCLLRPSHLNLFPHVFPISSPHLTPTFPCLFFWSSITVTFSFSSLHPHYPRSSSGWWGSSDHRGKD